MRRAEGGVAVVMAMGVVALAAVAATAILASQSAWSRRAELGADQAQAQELLQAGSDWARAVLSDDRRMTSIDHLGEPWALRLPPVPVDNGELVGRIEDQQGLFNVNNLASGGKLNVHSSRALNACCRFWACPRHSPTHLPTGLTTMTNRNRRMARKTNTILHWIRLTELQTGH